MTNLARWLPYLTKEDIDALEVAIFADLERHYTFRQELEAGVESLLIRKGLPAWYMKKIKGDLWE